MCWQIKSGEVNSLLLLLLLPLLCNSPFASRRLAIACPSALNIHSCLFNPHHLIHRMFELIPRCVIHYFLLTILFAVHALPSRSIAGSGLVK
jgi:hypothetical protein